MSYLDEIKRTKRVELTPAYWVDVRMALSFEEAQKLTNFEENSEKAQVELLLEVITAWNIDGAEGVLPLTEENIKKLDIRHTTKLIRSLTDEITAEQKKE